MLNKRPWQMTQKERERFFFAAQAMANHIGQPAVVFFDAAGCARVEVYMPDSEAHRGAIAVAEPRKGNQ